MATSAPVGRPSMVRRVAAAAQRDIARTRSHVRAVVDTALLLRQRVREDRCLQVAGSLTFTTLLALVPLITIAVTVFSALPVFAGFSTAIRQFVVTNLVPAAAGKVITVYTQQFADNAGRLTAWGIALLAVSAVSTMLTIDRAFNTIWRVRRQRPLISRLLIYWAVLTVGPLLIGASLSLTSLLLTLSMGWVRGRQGADVFLLKVVPLVLTCVAAAFLYRMVPSRRVATRDALAGGLLAGLAFEAMKEALGAYIRSVPTYKLIYGAFASVPIFLIWVYLSWLVILIGAEVTAALPYLRTGGVQLKRKPGSQFLEAMRLLQQIWDAHQVGSVMRTEELRASLRLPLEECEQMLERLSAAGWVAPALNDGWVLARDADEIHLADVYREFVFHEGQGSEGSFESALARLTSEAHEALSMTLHSVFTAPAERRRRAAEARAQAHIASA